MPKQFRQCHTVTVTPFTPDGQKIDHKALKRLLDWQHASETLGADGLLIAPPDNCTPAEDEIEARNGKVARKKAA